jgi:hypothetical protein
VQYKKTLFKIAGVALVAVLFLYPLTDAEPYSFLDAFLGDEIRHDIWIPMTLTLCFLCVQTFFLERFPNDSAGITGKRYFDNYLGRRERETKETKLDPKEKLKKAVRKIINVKRVFNPNKKEMNDHLQNPIYRLYLIAIMFWAYMMYLFYYKLIEKSQSDTTISRLDRKYECFFDTTQGCHPTAPYLYWKVLYLIFMVWLLVLIFQIKHGLLIWSSSIIEFNTYNSLRFSVYGALPFIRELQVILSFATNRTALMFDHWFEIEDIKFTMTQAKFSMKDKEEEELGVPVTAVVKWAIRVLVLVLILATMIGPLIFFSGFFEKMSEFPIENARIKIDVLTRDGLALNPMFDSSMMLKTGTIDRALVPPKWAYLRDTTLWKTTQADFLKYVRMSRFSQHLYEYTPDEDTKRNMINLLTGGAIRIAIEVRIQLGLFLQEFKIPITRSHADEIKTIMETDCSSIRLNREMFLENIPMVPSAHPGLLSRRQERARNAQRTHRQEGHDEEVESRHRVLLQQHILLHIEREGPGHRVRHQDQEQELHDGAGPEGLR